MEFKHIPVLLNETIELLEIKADGIYMDGTLGGGGHSEEILKRLDKGRLIAFDQDLDAIGHTSNRLEKYKDKLTIIHSNFVNAKEELEKIGINKLDGVLLDIGVSSYQIDEKERGFSYMADSLLDMRMDRTRNFTAKDIVNSYSKEELTDIFFKYGEEKWSKRIAEFIIEKRNEFEIETTSQLIDIIERAIPKAARDKKGHPAKRVFQALRIEVNRELDVLSRALPDLVELLNPKGRIAVITFHSLEDRIVKNTFREMQKDCICPPGLPVCVCGHRRKLKLVNNKAIEAGTEELENNSRARSAKLRVAERVWKYGSK